MPYIVVIIDEFGDLIMTAGKEVELPIARIAQLARAVGIHMVIATQRPTTSIITGNIKANFPGRIAFKVTAAIDSKTILDRTGANQLKDEATCSIREDRSLYVYNVPLLTHPKSSASTSTSANSLVLSNLWNFQNQPTMTMPQEQETWIHVISTHSSRKLPMPLSYRNREVPV